MTNMRSNNLHLLLAAINSVEETVQKTETTELLKLEEPILTVTSQTYSTDSYDFNLVEKAEAPVLIRIPLLKRLHEESEYMSDSTDASHAPVLSNVSSVDEEPSTPRFANKVMKTNTPSRGKGRPHKGTVSDSSAELNVAQKRSVFRAFKYYFAKDIYRQEAFLTRKKFPSEYKKLRSVTEESMVEYFGFEQWTALAESDKAAILKKIQSCKAAKTF